MIAKVETSLLPLEWDSYHDFPLRNVLNNGENTFILLQLRLNNWISVRPVMGLGHEIHTVSKFYQVDIVS